MWLIPDGAKPHLGSDRTAEILMQRVSREYELLSPYLPRVLGSVLDIGCGLAGMDIMLANYQPVHVFHLMDGRGEPKKQRGWSPDMSAWTDVEVGAMMLRLNSTLNTQIYGYYPDPTLTLPVDLIYSGASWGHHYPIAKYGQLAQRSLNKGGRIVLDVRRGTSGVADMKELGFACIALADDSMRKRQRFAFQRRDSVT